MYIMLANNFQKFKNQLKNVNVVLAGLVLITIFFVSYNYFNAQKEINNNPSIADKIKEALTRKGTVTPDAATDDRTAELGIGGELPEVAGSSSQRWVATDYETGDIKQGQYVVKKGDTLWEIAEAVYGDGTQWYKILDANKDSIGYLPNGSQALIITGQTLYIP